MPTWGETGTLKSLEAGKPQVPKDTPKIPAGNGGYEGRGKTKKIWKRGKFLKKRGGKHEDVAETKRRDMSVGKGGNSDPCNFDGKLEGHWQRISPEKTNCVKANRGIQ